MSHWIISRLTRCLTKVSIISDATFCNGPFYHLDPPTPCETSLLVVFVDFAEMGG